MRFSCKRICLAVQLTVWIRLGVRQWYINLCNPRNFDCMVYSPVAYCVCKTGHPLCCDTSVKYKAYHCVALSEIGMRFLVSC